MSTPEVTNAAAPTPTTAVRARPRRRLFIALSLLFPFIVLALIEGGLRLAGLGGYPPTFRRVATLEDGAALYVTDNQGPASYFFRNRSRPGTMHQTALVSPKPSGTFRIVLAGESAMKGFPQPRGLGAEFFLREMLRDAWRESHPERRVETINLGTTAVASFPALGMLTESLNFEPDLVVIYIGNNEFFGAYGVASLHSAGRSPAALSVIRAFRSTALAQGIDSLTGGSDATADKTLMEAMMGRSFISADDPARAAAARNLRVMIGRMIERCRDRGVPVIVCVPPVNERDLSPLGEPDMTGVPESERAQFAALLESRAVSDLESATRHAPRHATAWYRLGQAYAMQRRHEDAAGAMRKAVDLDTMPWRPPGTSVDAVREAAAAHGAVLCDMAQEFREQSEGGAIGWELMDDHVHPSLEGQALAARSIVKAMTGLSGGAAVSRESFDALPSWDAYAARLGANEFDRYGVSHQMRVLASIPFFRETNPGMLERFDALCRALEAGKPPELISVMHEWQRPESHKGEQVPLSGMAAKILVQRKEYAPAEALFRTASASVSEYSSLNLEYVYFMLMCRARTAGTLTDADLGEALRAVNRGKLLLGQGRSETGATERFVGRLLQVRREYAEAVPFLLTAREKLSGMDLVANDLALVESYVRTGRKEDARKLIQNGIDHSGQHAETYRRMLEMLGP